MNAVSPRSGDFGALLRILRRRALLIVIAVVVGLAGAYVFASSQSTQYTGTSVLLFRPLLLDAQLTGLPLQVPNGDPTAEAATDVGIVSLPQVRARAAKILGTPYTAASLKDAVAANADGKSALVNVTGTASTPQAAAAIANAMTQGFILNRRDQLVAAIDRAIHDIRQQLHSGGQTLLQRTVLRNNLTKLIESRSVQPADVSIVGQALPPTSPSSPKTTLDLIIGGALGLVLGLAFALLAEQIDPRVRRAQDVGDVLDLPVLASVPRSKRLKRSGDSMQPLEAADVEAFRLLRTNLLYRADGTPVRSVLLTSAGAGSGKTTVGLYLAAAAAAAMEGNVLLIEADMRRPRLGRLLGLPGSEGLSTALQSSTPLNEAVVSIEPGNAADHSVSANGNGNGNGHGPGDDHDHDAAPAHDHEASAMVNGHGTLPAGSFAHSFDVLPAGPPTGEASELLSSEAMTQILNTAKEDYDLIVIEGPPPGLVSDAIPLMKQVNEVVLVARLGKEYGPELERLRAQLRGLGVEPMGVVANFTRRTSNAYYSSSRS